MDRYILELIAAAAHEHTRTVGASHWSSLTKEQRQERIDRIDTMDKNQYSGELTWSELHLVSQLLTIVREREERFKRLCNLIVESQFDEAKRFLAELEDRYSENDPELQLIKQTFLFILDRDR